MWINLDLESVSYLSIANEKNDNVRNVEKMPVGAEKVPIEVEKVPIEVEKVPLEVEKVPIEVEKVPIEIEGVPIDNLSTQQRIIFQFVKENGRNIAFASCFIKL